jgi:dienelactone hydrolase
VGFSAFVQAQGAALRADDRLPESLTEWEAQRATVRKRLQQSWGDFPDTPCPLEPRTFGELKRDGYRVEKLTLQTRPGILMTANAYVPAGSGRRPAVLCVHGHWRGTKQDPVVQSRCIGLAKLGFFVLAVDAFGAGERALGKQLGEYHGEMVAATLFPTGLTLAGLQVYENMRAVDYLQTRSEVDPGNIGITGASGGGNQTMYAGAFDTRFGCVVPTCSVGTYQSYLTAACCMCELVPSALTYTEEWAVLALTAPRALMVINATQDAFQFSVGEAKKSVQKAHRVFDLVGRTSSLKHAIFESKHDYNEQMREEMYGWMTQHLKGEGGGRPIPEPPISVEDPEDLRCFPGESRPGTFVTLPQFASAEGRAILSRRKLPSHREHWRSEREMMLETLAERVLGRFPRLSRLNMQVTDDSAGGRETIAFEPEPGLVLEAHRKFVPDAKGRLAILLDLAGRTKAEEHPLYAELQQANWDVVTLDLRATGALAVPSEAIGNAPDHNSGQWSVWIGRPLLGQWVWDIRRLLDALVQTKRSLPRQTAIVGLGPAGVVAMCAAALEERIVQVAAVETLASYVSDEPYRGQRFGIMVPAILRDFGDIGHLASLTAPRQLTIVGGRRGNGALLTSEELNTQFQYTTRAYGLEGAAGRLTIHTDASPKAIVSILNG